MRPPTDAPSDPADAELVARALTGERAALEQLVRRHYRGAYIVALAVLNSPADAEDVCHDALVRAADRLEECRHPDRFGGWLRTIVRNQARNHAAKQAVREGPPIDWVTAGTEGGAPEAVERRELRATLLRGLAQLSPPQREVVLKHDLEDWSHEEIARSLGTSVGMSRQHLFQARRRLREILGRETLEEYRDG